MRARHFHSYIRWQKVHISEPFYFFTPQNEEGKEEYEKGFRIDELMKINCSGLVSMGDEFAFAETRDELQNRLNDFLSNDYKAEELKSKYNLGKNYANFILDGKKNGLKVCTNKIVPIAYRPFDNVYGYFDKQIIWRPREKVMRHFTKPNVGLACIRINSRNEETYFVVDTIMDKTILSSKDNANVFPLYLYSEEGTMDTEKRANLDEKIWAEISRRACLPGQVGKETTPEEVFDYIYGVLHSPRYRKYYREFLKVDFPRIPYPENAAQFGHFVSYGNRLRQLHLLHSLPDMPSVATFPMSGTCTVEQPRYAAGRVYINATQYFDHVPEAAWQFYIGGYQPAQKWLKDRKGRTLSFDDIAHYQKIIRVLLETDKLMGEIDG